MISCVTESNRFMQELDERKPVFPPTESYSLLKIIFSNILSKIGERDIGQWFLSNYLSLFFGTGIILALFQIFG